eukprot:365885-Chlamydomonas_euryale.AAC.10
MCGDPTLRCPAGTALPVTSSAASPLFWLSLSASASSLSQSACEGTPREADRSRTTHARAHRVSWQTGRAPHTRAHAE